MTILLAAFLLTQFHATTSWWVGFWILTVLNLVVAVSKTVSSYNS